MLTKSTGSANLLLLKSQLRYGAICLVIVIFDLVELGVVISAGCKGHNSLSAFAIVSEGAKRLRSDLSRVMRSSLRL